MLLGSNQNVKNLTKRRDRYESKIKTRTAIYQQSLRMEVFKKND